jgi:hypothetical protein
MLPVRQVHLYYRAGKESHPSQQAISGWHDNNVARSDETWFISIAHMAQSQDLELPFAFPSLPQQSLLCHGHLLSGGEEEPPIQAEFHWSDTNDRE